MVTNLIIIFFQGQHMKEWTWSDVIRCSQLLSGWRLKLDRSGRKKMDCEISAVFGGCHDGSQTSASSCRGFVMAMVFSLWSELDVMVSLDAHRRGSPNVESVARYRGGMLATIHRYRGYQFLVVTMLGMEEPQMENWSLQYPTFQIFQWRRGCVYWVMGRSWSLRFRSFSCIPRTQSMCWCGKNSSSVLPSGYVKIAVENGHRNSGFANWTWWFSI